MSLATGYLGIALLGATLILGALNVLRRKTNPVSTDLRRDVGIWCGIVSLAHVVIGLQVHMGSMLLYFFNDVEAQNHFSFRTNLFGLANYVGLFAVFLILFLLILSNDSSLRYLGKQRWKSFQRLNYVLMLLVVFHSIAYQILENRQLKFLIVFGLIVGGTLTIQILGIRAKKSISTVPVNRK
ncbi:MAG: ferric reductase-like transmembrane domain-containing protein [Pyrinomonadaceae bacterium]